ncbi:threonylcarbamoyl-AMP synthase [Rhodoferax lithotrophicus]|uniref:Threonylcarbamoyl-AMP synthase n=1 Tax=Rhodoferax lithotrophicus TaxID=2798804 RepID=A0ABM7MRI1_9BURK|nr:L-threonylcarbamoyladenylate synthase [Rhodoferax sp. MIZ03]BCO28978.1 threonylcarbamoyl-AMP synthase [Rhodoferax sp. MIZ03]
MILPASAPESIAAAADQIRAGKLLGLPTETVYGLAAHADDDAAVAQIFRAKGRPADHPLIVHVAHADAVAHYASAVPEFAQKLMQAFWPGPLTLILPRRPGVASAAAGGNPSIGLRCPSHPVAQALLTKLLEDVGLDALPVWGVAAPSANQFGRVSPTTAAHVQAEFGDDLLILDGGACQVGIESTIIDCTRGQPVLLRPGAITPAQVQAVCGLKVLLKSELSALAAPAPKASGTLESHYAPQATVRLMTAKDLQTALTLLGHEAPSQTVRPSIAVYSRTVVAKASTHVLYRRMPDDAASTAQQLFAALRDFDAQGVKLIWIETPPDAQDWDGVRDRLQRAAS